MTDYLLEYGIKSVLFWFVGIIAIFFAFTVLNVNGNSHVPTVPSTKWQAVFLNNNQVYFGKLTDVSSSYVTLSDVYYLRTASDLEQSTSLNLIKLGGELHGPEDTINIPKSSVLFWENMKDTSRVVQTIQSAQR
jgi:hypothetical protein